MRLADRLRALDDQMVWVESPSPRRLTVDPGITLAVGLLAVCVYVGWAMHWGWPRALVTVVVLVASLVAVARFWFAQPSDAERRPRVGDRGIGHDVDEVRHPGVEAAT